jgi:putative ABC transport system permease protein
MTAQKPHLPFSTFIMLAWRNLWRHKRRTFITLSSIALGFGLTVFSIGMQDSGHNNMVANAINMGDGHITVQHSEYLHSPANHRFLPNGSALLERLQTEHIEGQIAPRISLQILASTAHNSVGTALQGVESQNDPLRLLLEKRITDGTWLNETKTNGILIGDGMSRKLKVKIGSKVVIVAGKKGGDSEAQLARVQGIFRSGIDELDKFLIISNIDFASRYLIAEGGIKEQKPLTRIAIFLNDDKTMESWKATLSNELNTSTVTVLDWEDMLPQLVQYIVFDDLGAYIMQFIILVVIVFGIINTVLMGVLERTREFGLLRALGLSKSYLVMLIILETVLLSCLAVILGWMVGGTIHMYVATYGIDFSGMIPEGTTFAGTFMDPIVYSELSGERILQLTIIVFVATLCSGIYPAVKASRIPPIEALKT